MKRIVKSYQEFIKENFEYEESSSNPEAFDGIKKHLLNIVVEENDVNGVKEELIEFLTKLEDDGDNINITGLTDESDFYELYLEYRVEIDEKLNDLEYFNTEPSEKSIFSLYDFMISGVKQAVSSFFHDIKNKLQQ